MNKYFLPIISILILFQSFRVFDEIFYHDNNEMKKGFVIIDDEVEFDEKEKKSDTEEIDSIILSILDKDLVPGREEPTRADGLNPDLVEKAEKAIREALDLNPGVELEIKKSIKTQELQTLPK